MAVGYKFDERPLFAPGRHYLSLIEVENLCVVPFDKSKIRRFLFTQLEELVQRLLRENIRCDLRIDGSFLTEKLEPDDIDVAACLSFDFVENLLPSQKQLLYDMALPKYMSGLDTFVNVEYPRDHPEFLDWKSEKSWGEQWGIENGKSWLKGVAVLRLWETNVGLRIRR